MKPMVVLSGVLAIFAIAVGGSAARAGPLPAAESSVTCYTGTVPAGYVSDPVSCNGGFDSGLVAYAPFAGVSVSASGEAGVEDDAAASGYLKYSYEVTGGTPGDVVPVDIDVVLKAVPVSPGQVTAQISVAGIGGVTQVTICTVSCGAGTGVTSFTGTLHVDAVSGAVYDDGIDLAAEAGGDRGFATLDGGTASADPYIYVDPTFVDAGEYRIELSDGIGNGLPSAVTAVPEPGSFALLAAGLVALAVLRRGAYRRHGPRPGLA